MRKRGKEMPEVSLVMPVYNGSRTISQTLQLWDQALDGFSREIIVVNDGSRDDTADILDRLVDSVPGLRVIHQENSGHGPAVYRGYREAAGDWVFQADSDNEVMPSFFRRLWKEKDEADLVLGWRRQRRENLVRKSATALIPWAVFPLAGKRLHDINVPFRLIRRSALSDLLAVIPPDAFAPNAIMTVLASRWGLRLRSIGVPHHSDDSSGRSLAGKKFFLALGAAWRDLRRTMERSRGRGK